MKTCRECGAAVTNNWSNGAALCHPCNAVAVSRARKRNPESYQASLRKQRAQDRARRKLAKRHAAEFRRLVAQELSDS